MQKREAVCIPREDGIDLLLRSCRIAGNGPYAPRLRQCQKRQGRDFAQQRPLEYQRSSLPFFKLIKQCGLFSLTPRIQQHFHSRINGHIITRFRSRNHLRMHIQRQDKARRAQQRRVSRNNTKHDTFSLNVYDSRMSL